MALALQVKLQLRMMVKPRRTHSIHMVLMAWVLFLLLHRRHNLLQCHQVFLVEKIAIALVALVIDRRKRELVITIVPLKILGKLNPKNITMIVPVLTLGVREANAVGLEVVVEGIERLIIEAESLSQVEARHHCQIWVVRQVR